MAVRILPGVGQAELVLPRRLSRRKGLAFLREKAEWLEERLAKYEEPVPFQDGAEIPLLGRFLRIDHSDAGRADVRVDGNALLVACPKARISRSVTDWYRREAGCEIASLAKQKSAMLGRHYGRLSVRDTTTRWGSCSSSGDLSFSWRIIMAPEIAFDYLVAHEVAHLAEMNHSARFWTIVENLSEDCEKGRNWFRYNGHELHRYGLELSTSGDRESE